MQPKEYGIVFFDTQPHGAKIYVDGQILTDPDTEESLRTPERVLLIEGRRDFTFVLEGHKDLSGYVDVIAGTTVNIFRNMEPGESQEGWGEPESQIWLSQQQTGMIRIYSFPDGADVYVNGRHVGKAPIIVTDVPAGVATVEFNMPGMMTESKLVDIHPGAWSDVSATMRYILPELSQQSINYNMNRGEIMNTMEAVYNTAQYKAPMPGSIGYVTITTYPERATICIDGSVVTDETGVPITTPVTLTLLEGYHTIALELDGYYTGYEYIYVYSGEEMSTSTYLAKKMYMSAIESMQESNVLGDVVVYTYPLGAKIYIDGNLVVNSETMEPILTPTDLAVYAGYHDLRFTLEGYYDEFWGIYTIPGATQHIYRYFNISRSC